MGHYDQGGSSSSKICHGLKQELIKKLKAIKENPQSNKDEIIDVIIELIDSL